MLKYIKWLCLIIAIIGIIILGVIYTNNLKKTPDNNSQQKNYSLYDTAWYKTKIENYENNELVGTMTLSDPRYIIFNKDYVEYVYPEETKQYMYTYNDKILTITGPTNFLSEGSYKVSFDNNQLKLSNDNENKTKIYYFTRAEG